MKRHITLAEVESAQRELNDILGREQTPADFQAAVSARLKRVNAEKPVKAKRVRKINANESLFRNL